jgi:hypothetical protein
VPIESGPVTASSPCTGQFPNMTAVTAKNNLAGGFRYLFRGVEIGSGRIRRLRRRTTLFHACPLAQVKRFMVQTRKVLASAQRFGPRSSAARQ